MSLIGLRQHPEADVTKGKMVINYENMLQREKVQPVHGEGSRPPDRWSQPPPGWGNLNVDVAYMVAEGNGAAGMILRNHNGGIIFNSC